MIFSLTGKGMGGNLPWCVWNCISVAAVCEYEAAYCEICDEGEPQSVVADVGDEGVIAAQEDGHG